MRCWSGHACSAGMHTPAGIGCTLGMHAALRHSLARCAPLPPKLWLLWLAPPAPELYMGKRGFLFWANKAALWSVGGLLVGWAIFRFVGPALGLYQLANDL